MQTAKEAMLALLRGEKADFIPEAYTTIKDVVFPGERYFPMDGSFDPYGTGPDAWGVMWTNQGPNPIVDGNTIAKDFVLFDDMEEWKEHVKFPPIDFMPLEQIFQGMLQGMHVNRDEHVVSCLMLSGQFERLHHLIGMENAMCALYEYPDEVHEFFEAMCEYKLKCIDKAYEILKPDMIHMHDDWGMNNNMFMDPDLWREFIKPNEKRYADRIHEYGMIYMHHSCGYNMQIVPDMIECGIDAWNPVMVENDIPYLLETYGKQMTFAGGINNRIIDSPDATPETIITEIHRAMDSYCNPDWRYLPYYIPNVEKNWFIYMEEVNKYGRTIFQK